MGVQVHEFEAIYTDKEHQESDQRYNFSISTLKFRREFGFKFKDTVESLY